MSAALELPADHGRSDARRSAVGGVSTPEQAMAAPASSVLAPARALPSPAPAIPAAASNPPPPVLAEPPELPAAHTATEAHPLGGGGAQAGQRAVASLDSSPNPAPLRLADPLLALSADVLDDLESVRIANENRLRQLTRDVADSDGIDRGFGLPLDHPDVARLAALVGDLAKAEHAAALQLQRQMRKHPLGPWVKAARGVGEKQGARLLAAVGDPYINTLHDRPRTVSELWAYCGYHVLPAGDARRSLAGVAATRARGQRANWSATSKMRAHLVAVSCMKTTGPYRDIYEVGRAKYDGALHQAECRRCGPTGKPAQLGSPLSAGHQHMRALRLVAKELLKDLWREAKRLHELDSEGPDA